jgi:hypothetical protein
MSNLNPPLPLTYPDILCGNDVDPLGQETTSDLQNLMQDIQHVLQQDLGSNLDDPNRGVGIYNYLSGTNIDLQSLAGNIKSNLIDDPRIDSVSVNVQAQSSGIYAYIIYVDIGVSGTVLPLSFSWSQATGLVNTSSF